jgi:hypothetical protein
MKNLAVLTTFTSEAGNKVIVWNEAKYQDGFKVGNYLSIVHPDTNLDEKFAKGSEHEVPEAALF